MINQKVGYKGLGGLGLGPIRILRREVLPEDKVRQIFWGGFLAN